MALFSTMQGIMEMDNEAAPNITFIIPIDREDKSHCWNYFGCAAASCSVFFVLFHVSPWLSAAMCQGYDQMPRHKQLDFNARIGSSIHAVLASLSSLYLILFDEGVNHTNNVVWGHSPRALYVCSLVIGYMAADTLIQLCYREFLWNGVYIAHHLLIIFVESLIITFKTCEWFALYRHISEMSTPFLNGRTFLQATTFKKSSPVFLVNAVLITLSFFAVRVANIPIYYYVAFDSFSRGEHWELGIKWYAIPFSGIVLDSMNMMWFSRIIQGACRILLGKEPKKES